MKFTLLKTSDDDFKKIIEINTLEDLERLENKYKRELIISIVSDDFDKEIYPKTDGRYIEIYDDYREQTERQKYLSFLYARPSECSSV